jgi:hypothetical protein
MCLLRSSGTDKLLCQLTDPGTASLRVLLTCFCHTHFDSPSTGESHLTRLLQAAALVGNPLGSLSRHLAFGLATTFSISALDILCQIPAAKVGCSLA